MSKRVSNKKTSPRVRPARSKARTPKWSRRNAENELALRMLRMSNLPANLRF